MKTDDDNGMPSHLEQGVKAILTIQNDKLVKLDTLFHLLEEMTEITDQTIVWLVGYCEKHDIPLCQEKQLRDYVKLSKLIMTEIGETSSDLESIIKLSKLPISKLSDEWKHGNKSDGKVPEPGNGQFVIITVLSSTCLTSNLSQIRVDYDITWRMGNDYSDGIMDIFSAYETYSVKDGTIVLIDKTLNVTQVHTEAITVNTLSSEIEQLLKA